MPHTIELEVIGARQSVEIEAIADTGFDGDVCVSAGVAVTVGLELVRRQPVELADGTKKIELAFAGEVRKLGRAEVVEILLTESDDALVGTGLLDRFTASIDFPGGNVRPRSRRQPPRIRGLGCDVPFHRDSLAAQATPKWWLAVTKWYGRASNCRTPCTIEG